jgi:hypothetical protein
VNNGERQKPVDTVRIRLPPTRACDDDRTGIPAVAPLHCSLFIIHCSLHLFCVCLRVKRESTILLRTSLMILSDTQTV